MGLTIVIFLIGGLIILLGVVSLILRFFRKVDQGRALIVNTMRTEPIVTFTGKMVVPVIHKAEMMDISVKTIEIDRRGQDGLICKDNIRADIKVRFFVRVNPTADDVIRVAQSIGCERASDHETLEELFSAKFSEALKTVGRKMDFEELFNRTSFRDNIIKVVGQDLNGFSLEDAAIDYLDQTPLTNLDPNNMFDSQGITKITQLTSTQHIATNHAEREEEEHIAQRNAEAKERILEQERREADAGAKQKREISTVREREEAEIKTVSAQELLRSEQARIKTAEQIAVLEHNKQREAEVAEQNRLRVVGVETERVRLAQELEVIERERRSDLQRIAKEKELEEQKRDIANVIRERISVERTVAEEEERIEEVRAIRKAEREKQVLILNAEAQAEEAFVTDIKSAEAARQVAENRAKEQVILSEGQRDAAERQASAKIRLAESTRAEAAASGLAEVQVKEANAIAIEKEGLANARSLQEDLQVRAEGERQMGTAKVDVKLLDAEAQEKLGMAQVKVKEAEANAIEKQGVAEAKALEQQLLAEAKGLAEKFKSLDALSLDGRRHEEYRIHMEHQLKIQQAAIEAQAVVAEKQALVLSEAFKNTRIDIVGGDQQFLERMLNSLSMAKSLDGFIHQSDTSQRLFQEYLAGEANIIQDIKQILSNPALSSEDLKNMSLSAFLAKLISVTQDGGQKTRLNSLLNWINKAGLGDATQQQPPA